MLTERRFFVRVFLALASISIISWVDSGSVMAATFTVTNVNDTGPGSLRDTIGSAVSGDTINFGITGTVKLITGEIQISKNLTIIGPGSASLAIDGNNSSRIFTILSGTSSISGITIQHGNAGTPGNGNRGGGIQNDGILALSDVIITGNTSDSGAGIYNSDAGTLSIQYSSISNNVANFSGGGIDNDFGNMTLMNSTISNNTAGVFEGGISNTGILNLTNVTVSGNAATNSGGGIINCGSLTLTNSTISGNRAINGVSGGIGNAVAITSGGILHLGTAILTNVTVSGNTAALGGGGVVNGGVIIQGNAFRTNMEMTNVTINGNSSPDGGGILNGVGDIMLRNTIIANSPSGGNCSGIIISQGYNLSSDNTCNLVATGDRTSTNPLLGSLSDNGGPTFTHALLPKSPAIDAADPNNFSPTDQRGVKRPQGIGPDIGAFEFIPPVGIPTMTECGIIILTTLLGVGAVYHLQRLRIVG